MSSTFLKKANIFLFQTVTTDLLQTQFEKSESADKHWLFQNKPHDC